MDRVAELQELVKQEVAEWADARWLEARGYAVIDPQQHIYVVVSIPDFPRSWSSAVETMARLVGDTVVIEEDISDRPLYERLMQKGVPREKIILTYAGEPAPDASPES